MLFEQNTYRLICYSLGYDDLEAGWQSFAEGS